MESRITTVSDCKFISLSTVLRNEGKLTIVENTEFDFKRLYYIYDVPEEAYRGYHAHKNLFQLMIAVSGSFQLTISDGKVKRKFCLDNPKEGFLVVPGIWRELDNFSKGAVCLVLASQLYDESDYIRSHDEFLRFKNDNSINS